MNIVYKLLAIAALLLTQSVYALDPGGKPAERHGQSVSEISCPSADFSIFIRAFSNNTNVQQAFTKYPIQKQQLGPDAEPEPKKIVRNLERHQIQFPILPLREEREKRSLKIRTDGVTANKAKVTLIKPDTDYQVLYFFEKRIAGDWNALKIGHFN